MTWIARVGVAIAVLLSGELSVGVVARADTAPGEASPFFRCVSGLRAPRAVAKNPPGYCKHNLELSVASVAQIGEQSNKTAQGLTLRDRQGNVLSGVYTAAMKKCDDDPNARDVPANCVIEIHGYFKSGCEGGKSECGRAESVIVGCVARARGNVPMKSNLCQGQENPVETARICKDQAACEPEQVIACTLRTRVVSVRAPEHAGVTNGEILVETSGEQGEVTYLMQRVDVDRVHPPQSSPRFIDLSYGHYRVTAKDTVSQCSSTVEAELRPVCRQIELSFADAQSRPPNAPAEKGTLAVGIKVHGGQEWNGPVAYLTLEGTYGQKIQHEVAMLPGASQTIQEIPQIPPDVYTATVRFPVVQQPCTAVGTKHFLPPCTSFATASCEGGHRFFSLTRSHQEQFCKNVAVRCYETVGGLGQQCLVNAAPIFTGCFRNLPSHIIRPITVPGGWKTELPFGPQMITVLPVLDDGLEQSPAPGEAAP